MVDPTFGASRAGSSTASGTNAKIVARRARYCYLFVSFVCFLSCLIAGIVAYHMTHSLMVWLDVVALGCVGLANVISIGVEYIKSCYDVDHFVLKLDVAGSALSMLLLIGVAFSGVCNAFGRERVPWGAAHIQRFDVIAIYGCWCIFTNLAEFALFYVLAEQMTAVSTGGVGDSLNVVSKLMHSMADCLANVVMLVTWFALSSKRFSASIIAEVRVDAIGSLIICLCIGASVLFMGRDMLRSVHGITSLKHHSDAQAFLKHAEVRSEKDAGYGAIGFG